MTPSLYTKTITVDDAVVAVRSLLVDVSALKSDTNVCLAAALLPVGSA